MIDTTAIDEQAINREQALNIAGMSYAAHPRENQQQETSETTADQETLVDQSQMLNSDRQIVNANSTTFRILTSLILATFFAAIVFMLFSFWSNVTGGNSVSQDELPETSEAEVEAVEVDKEDNLKAELALTEQKGDLQPSKPPTQPSPQLVKEEPAPAPAPAPETPSTPRPTSRPSAAPRPIEKAQADPLEEWARLSQLGNSIGEPQAAVASLNDTSSTFISTRQTNSAPSATRSRNPNPPLPLPVGRTVTDSEVETVNREREEENEINNDRPSSFEERETAGNDTSQIASISVGDSPSNLGNSSLEEFENFSPGANNILNDTYPSIDKEPLNRVDPKLPARPILETKTTESQLERLSSLGNTSTLLDSNSESISPTNQTIFDSQPASYKAQKVSYESPANFTSSPQSKLDDSNSFNAPQKSPQKLNQNENNLTASSNQYRTKNPRLPSVRANTKNTDSITKPKSDQTQHLKSNGEFVDSPIAQTQNRRGSYQVPFGAIAVGEISASIVWSEGVEPAQTRGIINLSEPLLTHDGSVALEANTSIVVEVETIANNGLTVLRAIALSYENSQGKLVQENLPPGGIIIKGEENQPLIASKTTDSGGTLLGQDVLLSAFGAGERGFEVLNQPSNSTVVSDDDFFSRTVQRDASLANGAAEGAFSTAKERLEDRSKRIESEELSRTPIYQIEAGTTVSIFINSFLEINR